MPFDRFGVAMLSDHPDIFTIFYATQEAGTGFLKSPEDLTENNLRAKLQIIGYTEEVIDSQIAGARKAFQRKHERWPQ